MIIDNEKHIMYFERLKNQNVINLFTNKPYNFRRVLVSDEEIQKNYHSLEDIVNQKFDKIVKPNQNHTHNVKVLNETNINEVFQDVDGLITNIKNVALVTSLADCQGILLFDKENKVIGNIHSGWKGTLNRIIENAIKLMMEAFDSKPENIEAYIVPSILNCCFEVDEDIKELFLEKIRDIDIQSLISLGEIKEGKQKYLIDTVSINKQIMLNLGLKENNIILSNICSKCNSNIIHSHRADGVNSGRNIAIIALK